MKPTVIICPGNGCSNIRQCNWYGRLADELAKREIPVICEDFPDPQHARRLRWIPFMRSLAERATTSDEATGRNTDHDTTNVVLVGHSSGAQAALRYAEKYALKGCVLVSATYSDLDDPHERASGYYPQPNSQAEGGEDNPYNFAAMKENCPTWYQFHSDDDPFIPLHEAENIRDGLVLEKGTEHKMLPGRSHFFQYAPEILDKVLSIC